ncbi:sensor histidine kinase [Nonomuraea ferruginea]|uniref:histidine kinase n=1 Tax=Nonomuraea ferruginea TaxID=46174 RepID=A0ABT4TBI7_9ACTN|nr:nitrate- and nitrite sensing domain-containing protein [Nonomuraea ferruginea]MDA0646639.1 nitrate- and nitrite sensing domain-containing protein [Nonomuraea ferruginea]
MRVRTRLVLVLAVPTLLLITGMAAEAAARLHARADADATARHVTLVLAVQDLVHALQRERALLAALLAGEPRVRPDLVPARHATDHARSALSHLLATAPPTAYGPVRDALARLPTLDRPRTGTPALALSPDAPATPGGPLSRTRQATPTPTAPLVGPYGALVSPGAATLTTTTDGVAPPTWDMTADGAANPTLDRTAEGASDPAVTPTQDAVAGTEGTGVAGVTSTQGLTGEAEGVGAEIGASVGRRAPVDRGPKVRQDVFEAFTDVITELADGSFGTEVGRSDPSLLRRLQALEAISRAKEAAARQRAVVTAAFATGAFTQGEYITFLEARASMTDALDRYRRTAGPQGVAALERTQRGAPAARTARLERRAIAASPGTPLTVRTRTWLSAGDAYADALRAVQHAAGREVHVLATAARERHTRHLTWLAGLGAAFLLVMGALGALMARSITRPLRRLTGEATALARHIATLEAAETPRLAVPGTPPSDLHAPGTRPAHLWRAYDASFPLPSARLPSLGNASYGRETRRAGTPGQPASRPTSDARQDHSREVPGLSFRVKHPLSDRTHSLPSKHPLRVEPTHENTTRDKHPLEVAPPYESTSRDKHLQGGEPPYESTFRLGEDPAQGTASGFGGASSGGEVSDKVGGAIRSGETAGEFARLAGALGDMHEAAVRIAAGRAAIRRDAAASLGELGTRHRDLVHRQLTFISVLQRDESDPAVLARLCELDRVTSRLRRNAESLLVLTGTRGQRRSSEPVPVDEVLRSVLAEVEEHHRVALRVVGRAHVRGPVVAEVAHMLAELMENALGYSPPESEVDVVSRAAEGECRVTISDYGMGMTAGELAAANARLRGEQSFLVAPTRCLGHHVVGRLAERLGVRVSLHPSPGRGVTAQVTLPEELLAVQPAEAVNGSR